MGHTVEFLNVKVDPAIQPDRLELFGGDHVADGGRGA
jgi:hypothetical protein